MPRILVTSEQQQYNSPTTLAKKQGQKGKGIISYQQVLQHFKAVRYALRVVRIWNRLPLLLYASANKRVGATDGVRGLY